MGSFRTRRRRRQRLACRAAWLDDARWNALTPEQQQADDPERYRQDRFCEVMAERYLTVIRNQLAVADRFNRAYHAGDQWDGATIGARVAVRRPRL